MHADFPTLAYLAPSIEMIDLPEELTVASLEAVVPAGRSLAFVVIPQRAEVLPALQEAFSGGRAESVVRPTDRRHIATLYVVPSDG